MISHHLKMLVDPYSFHGNLNVSSERKTKYLDTPIYNIGFAFKTKKKNYLQ